VNNLSEFLSLRPSGTLYHYTDASAFISIWGNKELWATSVHHLNDSKEYAFANQLLREEVERRLSAPTVDPVFEKRWREIIREPDSSTDRSSATVVSFSTNGDQLSQWRAYCSKGNGYSIGFSWDDLAYARSSTRSFLVKCLYGEDEQRQLVSALVDHIELRFRRMADRRVKDDWSFLSKGHNKIDAVMLAFKDKGFSEENEWRLIVDPTEQTPLRFRSGRFGILPYCGVPLCKQGLPRLSHVIVGPTPEPEVAKRAIFDLLARKSGGWANLSTPVTHSEIPYRY
jgi:hypothetical protein